MSFILASPAPTPATNSFFFFFLGGLLGTDGEKSACIALLNGCLANEKFYIYIYTAIPRK